MKKLSMSGSAALVVLVLAAPAGAELCAIDNVPAATLLVPYFEVDPTKKGKVNTVVSVRNTEPVATVAHVTLWTDWAMATLSFDVFLTGNDVVTIDLRKILFEGELPQTAHSFNDPDDSISPHGDFPSWDSAPDNAGAPVFSGCDQDLPPAPLDGALVDQIRAAHTGQDAGEGCLGSDHGDGLARGYVTIDNVNDCSSEFPGGSGYFGPDGVASDVNQLQGEFYITEKSGRGIAAGPAVAVEADPGFSGNGNVYTFYGRYVEAAGDDRREPLATTWMVRYLDSLPFGKGRRSVQSDLLIWRDTAYSGLQVPRQCRTGLPAWLPLDETQIVAFDEKSQAVQICRSTTDPVLGDTNPTCAPLATQRVRLGEGDWATPTDPGWFFINLNMTASAEGTVSFGGLAQSYVVPALSVNRLRGAATATVFASACGASKRRRGR